MLYPCCMQQTKHMLKVVRRRRGARRPPRGAEPDAYTQHMSASFLAAVKARGLDATSHASCLCLLPDIIQHIACACTGVEALHWCAVTKEHRASRPLLRLLIVDEFDDDGEGMTFVDPCNRIFHLGTRGTVLEPGGPVYMPLAVGRTDDGGLRAVPVASRLTAGGVFGELRLRVRASDGHVHRLIDRISDVHAREITHLVLQTCTDRESVAYAQTYEALEGRGRLALTTDAGGGVPLPTPARWGVKQGHGARLESLRVLQITRAEAPSPFLSDAEAEYISELGEPNWARRGGSGAQWRLKALLHQLDGHGEGRHSHRVMARYMLVQNTLATLRSLSIVDASPGVDAISDLTSLFRVAGPHLHYLSVLALRCTADVHLEALESERTGREGPAVRLCRVCTLTPVPMPRPGGWEDAMWQGAADEDEPAEAEVDEAEMETEVLQNAAQGLLISLREPARVRAHLTLPREPVGSARDGYAFPFAATRHAELSSTSSRADLDGLDAAVGQVCAALAEPRWLD